MPSATGQSWEKYQKEFADDEAPEKKITPLTDESVIPDRGLQFLSNTQAGTYKYSKPTAQPPMLLR
jgi:hypothetical protein